MFVLLLIAAARRYELRCHTHMRPLDFRHYAAAAIISRCHVVYAAICHAAVYADALRDA